MRKLAQQTKKIQSLSIYLLSQAQENRSSQVEEVIPHDLHSTSLAAGASIAVSHAMPSLGSVLAALGGEWHLRSYPAINLRSPNLPDHLSSSSCFLQLNFNTVETQLTTECLKVCELFCLLGFLFVRLLLFFVLFSETLVCRPGCPRTPEDLPASAA